MDIAASFAAAADRDPARPFITFYDDATAERTELSYSTMDNWVAKTANLLVDEFGLEPGDTVSVRMPAHWLTGAIILGCWRAGVSVAHGPVPVAVDFADETDSADPVAGAECCLVALAPLAIGVRTTDGKQAVADGAVDFLTEVRGHGDHFRPSESDFSDRAALVGLPGGRRVSQDEVIDSARRRAQDLGVSTGDRILLSGEVLRPLDWLLMPLVVSGSVVLCRNASGTDLVARAGSEKAQVIEV